MKAPSSISILKFALVLIAPVFFWGCATTYDLTVDSINNPKAPKAESYRLVNKNRGANEQDLRTKEAETWIKTALSGRGLYEAPNPDKADMTIEVNYGMEAPRTKFVTYEDPVFASVPGEVSLISVPIRDKSGNIIGNQTVAMRGPPQTVFAGNRESVEAITVYPKYLKLTAVKNRVNADAGPPSQLWSVNVTNEDESDDLRKILPAMASVAADNIGTDSKTQKDVRVRANDAGVTFVKAGM